MISRLGLSELSEGDFRRTILMPLFRSMGFSGVEELHGPTEFGKDIVMWRRRAQDAREVYGVVVKTGNITGKVDGTSGTAVVFTQAMQALGSTFVNKSEVRSLPIDKVWVVTTGKIGKPATEALHAAFGGAGVLDRIRLVDGDELWQMLREFSPERTALAELQETSQLFNNLNPNYRINALIEGGRVQFGVEAKHENAHKVEPLFFNLKFDLPNTTEGQQLRDAWDAHVRTGSPVRIPGEFVASLDVPELLKPFFRGQPGSIELKPSISNTRVSVTLTACAEGPAATDFPLHGFELRCIQRGTEEATFESEGPYAFDLVVVLNYVMKHVIIRFRDSGKVRNARQNWFAAQFFNQLAQGGHLSVRDEATGIRLFHLQAPAGQFQAAAKPWLRFSEALNFLQEITSTVITMPETITGQDMADVVELADRIPSGIWSGGMPELSMTIKPGCLPAVMQGLNKPAGETLTVTQEDQWFEIFGQRLQLGTVVMIVRAMGPADDSLQRAVLDDGAEPFELTLVRRGKKDNLTLAYPKFLDPTRRAELAALAPNLVTGADFHDANN